MIYTQEQLDGMTEPEKFIAVAEKLELDVDYEATNHVHKNGGKHVLIKCGLIWQHKGYSRPDDIMPIAFEYKIGLMAAEDCWFAEWFSDDDCCTAGNANPLIAIVDCFLMMEIEI